LLSRVSWRCIAHVFPASALDQIAISPPVPNGCGPGPVGPTIVQRSPSMKSEPVS